MGWKRCTEAGTVPASLLLGVVLLLSGCGVQVSSTSNLTGATLSCPDFVSRVFPILTTSIGGKACSDCHYSGSTTGGGFKFFPQATSGSSEMTSNYYAALGFSDLNTSANSRLLLKPLGDPSVGGHGGGTIFSGTSDVNYLVVLAWINNRIQGPSQCP